MTEQELVAAGKDLPEAVKRRGVTEAQWRTLMTSLYPGAKGESVLMVIDYCIARRLDPMKRPCHIVPMQVKNQRTGEYEWREVILPGIYELRTTAQRTGVYLGQSAARFGPEIEHLGVKAPEWAEVTIFRWNTLAGQVGEFVGRAVFAEVAGTSKKDSKPRINDRWAKAPTQMLVKCAEADGLRRAFPDELGGVDAAEEIEGNVLDAPFASPKGGLDFPDDDTVTPYVSRVADMLAADLTEEELADHIFAMHLEVYQDAGLYTAIQDALKNSKILTVSALKKLVDLGSKRYQARPTLNLDAPPGDEEAPF